MESKQPTRAEQQEFWKWCGFKYKRQNDVGFWCSLDNKFCDRRAPPIDLTNLFRWAEKSLVDHFIATTPTEEEYRKAYYDFLCKWLRGYIWNEPHDPALALFWAIWSGDASKLPNT